MDVYVGMDVHRKHSQVAIVDAAGAPTAQPQPGQRPGQADPDPWRPRAGHPVAFEAAYGWGWLVDLLEDLELEPHLVHPSRRKAIASARLKNDKVDAAMAQLLRADLLPEAWIAPQQVRDLRALLRHRAALVRLSTSCKNRIHSRAEPRHRDGVPVHIQPKEGETTSSDTGHRPAPSVCGSVHASVDDPRDTPNGAGRSHAD